jgi:chitinase
MQAWKMIMITGWWNDKGWLLLIIANAALLFALPACGQKPEPRRTHPQVIGYFTEGGVKSGRYTVKSVVTSGAASRLTTLDYAFGRVQDNQCQIADVETAIHHAYAEAESVDGTADPAGPHRLRGTFHQLQELKRRFPKLKIVISFGGWSQSQGFSTAAQPEHVRDFVHSCVQTFIRGNFAPGIHALGIFDGIDIDWEYPVEGGTSPGVPEDARNFTAMAAEFRRQLDAVRPGLLLTAALPAEPELYKNFELKKISRPMNGLSVMVYDLHWNSEPVTNLHSPLFHDPADPSKPPQDTYFGDYAVQGFLQAGVPARKIIFGVPFYGKGWTGVKDTNHGLYQPATGPAKQWGSYRILKALTDADRQYYATAITCSVWSGENFWSYDCPEALKGKMEYIRSHRLGGVMFWELSQDTDDGELLQALTPR